MVASLSVLTKLEILTIIFESSQSCPETSRHSFPETRTLLLALTTFDFGGVKEYLEELVAQIDAPLLDEMVITFFHQGVDSDIPQLTKFFGRTPKLKAHDEAHGVLHELRRFCYISIKRNARVGKLMQSVRMAACLWRWFAARPSLGLLFARWSRTPLRPEGILATTLRWQDDIETLHPFIALKGPYITIVFSRNPRHVSCPPCVIYPPTILDFFTCIVCPVTD